MNIVLVVDFVVEANMADRDWNDCVGRLVNGIAAQFDNGSTASSDVCAKTAGNFSEVDDDQPRYVVLLKVS